MLRLTVLLFAVPITACQVASAGAPAPGARASTVAVYRYAGSKQCEPGGLTPEQARRQLSEARIEVLSATCGHDGRMNAATCGTSDGRIVILEVRAGQERAARERGFAPLAELPEAGRSACR